METNHAYRQAGKKLTIFILAGVAVLALAAVTIEIRNNYHSQPAPKSGLSEAEAQAIAEQSCIKGGEALSAGSYNEMTKTWWFDANLNATREGCNPACVVSEETKTAEINWRCTGLKTPDNKSCGIENCHGLDIVCGEKPAEICTEMYQLGDRCRQFAECGMVNGGCRQIENSQFTLCRSCALKCEKDFPNDPGKAFTCESKCGERGTFLDTEYGPKLPN